MRGLQEFFYDLLVSERILPKEMLQKMQAAWESRPFKSSRKLAQKLKNCLFLDDLWRTIH